MKINLIKGFNSFTNYICLSLCNYAILVEALIIYDSYFIFPYKLIRCQHLSSKYVITKSDNPINLQNHLHILKSQRWNLKHLYD